MIIFPKEIKMSKVQRINNLRTRAIGELDILTIEKLASILKMHKEDVKNWFYKNNLVKTINSIRGN